MAPGVIDPTPGDEDTHSIAIAALALGAIPSLHLRRRVDGYRCCECRRLDVQRGCSMADD
jgi:hypothetical protein